MEESTKAELEPSAPQEGLEPAEEVITPEEKADFKHPIEMSALPTLASIKEQFELETSIETLDKELLTHSLTLNDIEGELARAKEKYIKFKNLNEELFTKNNYVENEESYNLRQYTKCYQERIAALQQIRIEEIDIKNFLETKLEHLQKGDTTTVEPLIEKKPEPTVSTAETPSQKFVDKIKKWGKLFLTFSKPKQLPEKQQEKSIDEISETAQ